MSANQMQLAQENYDGLSAFVEGHWKPEQVRLISEQIANDAGPADLALFLQVAKHAGLDPFRKQIYAVFRYDNRKGRKVMTIQTGIDGYRAIADRTGKYAGNDDPVFVEGHGHPESATVTVWKIVGGQRFPFTATARWSEYYPGDKQGKMWKRMPHLMLAKCAEALALRKAFPDGLSGLYTDEEMDQADSRPVHVELSDTTPKKVDHPPAELMDEQPKKSKRKKKAAKPKREATAIEVAAAQAERLIAELPDDAQVKARAALATLMTTEGTKPSQVAALAGRVKVALAKIEDAAERAAIQDESAPEGGA